MRELSDSRDECAETLEDVDGGACAHPEHRARTGSARRSSGRRRRAAADERHRESSRSLTEPLAEPAGSAGRRVATARWSRSATAPERGARRLSRWLDRPAGPDDGESKHVIAPAGEGLWRRAPWPAADALFDLARTRRPAADCRSARRRLPAVGAERGLRAALAERAAERGRRRSSQADRLDAAALAGAGCIVMAESPGGALPARAFAVLAAGAAPDHPAARDRRSASRTGSTTSQFAAPDEALDAVTGVRAPRSRDVRPRRVWGRLKAEQQRASVVYARLAEDLRLQRLLDRRLSAAATDSRAAPPRPGRRRAPRCAPPRTSRARAAIAAASLAVVEQPLDGVGDRVGACARPAPPARRTRRARDATLSPSSSTTGRPEAIISCATSEWVVSEKTTPTLARR